MKIDISNKNTTFLAYIFTASVRFIMIVFMLVIILSVISHSPNDRSFSVVNDSKIENIMGVFGAYLADLILQYIGLSGLIIAVIVLFQLLYDLYKKNFLNNKFWYRLFWFIWSLLFLCIFFAILPRYTNWVFIVGLGGFIGDVLIAPLLDFLNLFISPLSLIVIFLLSLSGSVYGIYKFLEINGQQIKLVKKLLFTFIYNFIVFCFEVLRPLKWKIFKDNGDIVKKSHKIDIKNIDIDNLPKPVSSPQLNIIKTSIKSNDGKDDSKNDNISRVAIKVKTKQSKDKVYKVNNYTYPDISLLDDVDIKQSFISDEQLKVNASNLESILKEYNVAGHIINIRPGPVVTMYELRAAPGIKSSRVIALAEDLARSMAVVSCRVAVVSERNVIGIELPNDIREMVSLKGIIGKEIKEYRDNKNSSSLNLILGKNISGTSVRADLTTMPHLLIAGTTGSGKSVGINAMILSLLYQKSPEHCRLIMIDPKMLELSVYDGIPHLLTPVVTDPKKAVVALKWAVKEMEERYQLMSKVGVRNINGLNEKIVNAAKNNKQLFARVQKGIDEETGELLYEKEEVRKDTLPFIVVIIDEMADLMMVAGKDVEAVVQRLAQMARAAGIHLIMATQRPSVDVITGTIKANFPTRISFQVSSKIDSRTILGEQGAEQLLGSGDMLYMERGGRINRIHGAYVSDEEVTRVVDYLKLNGKPQYEKEVLDYMLKEENGSEQNVTMQSGNELYDKAVAIILRDKKPTTSYIQRRLSIGYNKAATLIELMEENGIISSPNGSGKREILVGE